MDTEGPGDLFHGHFWTNAPERGEINVRLFLYVRYKKEWSP